MSNKATFNFWTNWIYFTEIHIHTTAAIHMKMIHTLFIYIIYAIAFVAVKLFLRVIQ